jgi:hypothetical protein
LAEDFYEAPRAEISQGDILELLPNAYLTHPLRSFVSGHDGSLVERPEPQIDGPERRPVIASCRRTRAILITHDCEVDKPKIENWIVCPVVPLAEHPGAQHTDIRKNKYFNLMYLPAYREILGDSVAVLNQITTLQKAFVQSASRLLSLSDVGRAAFYFQSIRWMTRWQLANLRCPHCGIAFNAADGMSVRAD